MRIKENNWRVFISLLFILWVISSFLIFANIYRVKNEDFPSGRQHLSLNNSKSDILEFWDKEIEEVYKTPLNIEIGQNSTFHYKSVLTNREYAIFMREIFFDSPHWRNHTSKIIRLHGYILYPENPSKLNPGCLCMHGLLSNTNRSFDLAIPYLEKGFIVLTYDHPGHGKSEGPIPTSDNFYYKGDFNSSAHQYLTICGAIQGLRILREIITSVNNSQIIVTGSSYGGITSMWLGGICGEKIAGIVANIAVGDFTQVLNDPNKLFYLVLGKSQKELVKNYDKQKLLTFDPIYYISSEAFPPILWQYGTDDDFFHRYCINGTYKAVKHDEKFVQLYPNGHHFLLGTQNSTKYFMEYVLNSKPTPLDIKEIHSEKRNSFIGEKIHINLQISSNVELKSVKAHYKYLDILGSTWKEKELTKAKNGTWQVTIEPSFLSSEVEYFITFILNNSGEMWFSSLLYRGDKLKNHFSVFHSFLILTTIISPIGIFLFISYNKEIVPLPKGATQRILKQKQFIFDFSFIAFSEFLFYTSIFLPWTHFGDLISWNHIYLFNHFFTWEPLIGGISQYLTIITIISWILNSFISIFSPIISGIVKIAYPIIVLALILLTIYPLERSSMEGVLSLVSFGNLRPGIGIFLMLSSAIMLSLFGFWKRKHR